MCMSETEYVCTVWDCGTVGQVKKGLPFETKVVNFFLNFSVGLWDR